MSVYIHALAFLWGCLKNWYMYLHKYIYLHIIYRQVFIKSGTYKSKYDGLPEGFQLVRITEQRACSENVSTENFRGKFKSISIVDEAYFYKLLLEQQLVADIIFYVWYCCGNKMSPGVWKEKQRTVGNKGETKWRKAQKKEEADNEVLKKDVKWDTGGEKWQGKENWLDKLYLLLLLPACHLKHWSYSALLKCFEAFVRGGVTRSGQTWWIFIDLTGV